MLLSSLTSSFYARCTLPMPQLEMQWKTPQLDVLHLGVTKSRYVHQWSLIQWFLLHCSFSSSFSPPLCGLIFICSKCTSWKKNNSFWVPFVGRPKSQISTFIHMHEFFGVWWKQGGLLDTGQVYCLKVLSNWDHQDQEGGWHHVWVLDHSSCHAAMALDVNAIKTHIARTTFHRIGLTTT